MGVLVDALKSVDFLHGEPDETVQAFLVAGRCVDREKGETLWRAGSPPQSIVIPVTGEAKTVSHGTDGREFIDRFIGPGECLGLQSTLDGLPHPTSAEIARAGAFFELPRSAALQLFDRFASARTKAVETVGRMYRRSVRDREDVVLRPVPERLARFLVEHACVRQSDGAKVLVHATQSEIAARLGTVREVVARTLSDFISRGLVARTDSGLFVGDWSGLCAMASIELDPRGGDTPSGAQSKIRTARFYLPRSEEWTKARESDPLGCLEHTGDLTPCERAGCPGAREELDRRRRDEDKAKKSAAKTAAAPSESPSSQSPSPSRTSAAPVRKPKKRA